MELCISQRFQLPGSIPVSGLDLKPFSFMVCKEDHPPVIVEVFLEGDHCDIQELIYVEHAGDGLAKLLYQFRIAVSSVRFSHELFCNRTLVLDLTPEVLLLLKPYIC